MNSCWNKYKHKNYFFSTNPFGFIGYFMDLILKKDYLKSFYLKTIEGDFFQ